MSLIASVQATPGSDGGDTGAGINTTTAKLFIAHAASFVAASGVSDNKGLTWHPLTLRTSSDGATNSQLWWATGVGGTGHIFNIAGAGIYSTFDVVCYDDDLTFDAEAGFGSSANSNTIQPGSVNPFGDNELFVAGVCWGVASNNLEVTSIDSSFTIRQQTAFGPGVNLSGAIADKTQTTGGAENPTWTRGGASDKAACSIAVFKPPAAPPPAGWGQRLAGERNRRVRGL